MKIVREFCKLIMFVTLFATPTALIAVTGNNHFAWLYALSCAGVIFLFTHYEDVAQIESTNKGNSNERAE